MLQAQGIACVACASCAFCPTPKQVKHLAGAEQQSIYGHVCRTSMYPFVRLILGFVLQTKSTFWGWLVKQHAEYGP